MMDQPIIPKNIEKIKGIKLLTQKKLRKRKSSSKWYKIIKADYILIQDADLEYFPSDIPKMLKKFNK